MFETAGKIRKTNRVQETTDHFNSDNDCNHDKLRFEFVTAPRGKCQKSLHERSICYQQFDISPENESHIIPVPYSIEAKRIPRK